MGEGGITCAVCGTVNAAGDRFCQECGTRLAVDPPEATEATPTRGEGRSPVPAEDTIVAEATRPDSVGAARGSVPDGVAGPAGEPHGEPAARPTADQPPPGDLSPGPPPPFSESDPSVPTNLPDPTNNVRVEPAPFASVEAAPWPSDTVTEPGGGPTATRADRPAWSFPTPLTPPPRPGALPPPVVPPPSALGRGGNWFTTTPPRSIMTLGFALLLVSCVATTVGRGLVGGGLDLLAVCLGPVGVGLIVFALIRMASQRPRRRF